MKCRQLKDSLAARDLIHVSGGFNTKVYELCVNCSTLGHKWCFCCKGSHVEMLTGQLLLFLDVELCMN